ncbi:MAG: DUF4339 domain-containing protein [Chlamydiia bacterium]|nr:DUF4339 domain-containing protein [Chlamydiia bacterium]
MHIALYLLSWLTLGWICSRMAEKRGRNPMIWGTLGVILGLIAVFILYFLPSKKEKEKVVSIIPNSTEKVCNKPPEKLWYYLDKEKKEHGPMSFYALQEAWDDDKITAKTYVWNEEMDHWTHLEDLADLLARIRRAPLRG